MLDLDMQKFINTLKKSGLPDISKMTAVDARRTMDQGANAIFPLINDPDVAITNQTISLDDTDLSLRVYTPKAKSEATPAFVFFHGGGFVLGSIEEYDHLCVSIAKHAGCTVFSVAYRLAPEFPFPIPPEDCYNATVWIASHAEMLKILPHKIFVGGDSAGGCLAAVVALMVRDRIQRPLAGQILLYPALNRSFDTASYLTYGHLNVTADVMMWFWNQYLADKTQIHNPYAVPFYTNSFTALAPALVITAECDPVHDEGEAYAEQLKKGNSLYAYHCYEGMVHVFPLYADRVASAKKATENLVGRIAQMINEL
jgi:acetyl esterase